MFLFKVLFSFGLLMADLPAMDAEGWVSIERPRVEDVEGADERDPSIWVVFAKQIGPEKILISFPDEPTYTYKNGGLEVFSKSGGHEHWFQVLDQTFQSGEEMLRFRLEQLGSPRVVKQKTSENSAELVVWKDGFWLQEKIVKSDYRAFIMQTKSVELEPDFHREFTRSFDHSIDPKF
jgi:hypothetical protein